MAREKATEMKSSTREGGVNKTAEIKKILYATPDKSPKEIAEELTAQGLNVSSNYVSTIKTNMKAAAGAPAKKAGKKKASTKKVASTKQPAAATPASNITFEQLRMAKDLARDLGGVDEAKEALAALSELVG